MELTRLLVTFLCVLASEVNSARLATVTTLRHRTENATTRALAETNEPDVVAPKKILFSYETYAKTLYERIDQHLNDVDQGIQFAFIMIARSHDLRFDFPQSIKEEITGPSRLPPINNGGTYPADGNSNLVIAGLDKDKPKTSDIQYQSGLGKKKGKKFDDIEYHSERQLIAKMPAMDKYYDRHYFEDSQRLICPWVIVLGSRYDTCYNVDESFGRCANKFLAEKEKYVEQTTCTSTTWVVYVDKVRKQDQWMGATAEYAANDILAFANVFSQMPESNEQSQKAQKTKRSTSSNETLVNSTLS